MLHVVAYILGEPTTTRRLLSFDARRGAVIVNGRGRTSSATILPRYFYVQRCHGEQDRDTQLLALCSETERTSSRSFFCLFPELRLILVM